MTEKKFPFPREVLSENHQFRTATVPRQPATALPWDLTLWLGQQHHPHAHPRPAVRTEGGGDYFRLFCF